jgi:hypothetical protein
MVWAGGTDMERELISAGKYVILGSRNETINRFSENIVKKQNKDMLA